MEQRLREKISEKQKGISVPSRGRLGHAVSFLTRQKISFSKKGKSVPKDYSLLASEMVLRNNLNYATTEKLIPDGIFIENNKLIAIEIEKKNYLADVRTKMRLYLNKGMQGYDQIIIVWFLPNGQRQKSWCLSKSENEWKAI